MKRLIAFLFGVLSFVAAHATLMTGSIQWSDGGIEASDTWGTPSTTLAWEVEDVGGGEWLYSYRAQFAAEVISASRSADVRFLGATIPFVNRIIFQVDETITDAEMFDVMSPGVNAGVDRWDMGLLTLYGLKIEDLQCFVCEFSFRSRGAPVYSGFFVDGITDDGEVGFAYNTYVEQFLPVSNNGQVPFGFILVPGRVPDATQVAEPATLLLALCALMFLYRRRGRK